MKFSYALYVILGILAILVTLAPELTFYGFLFFLVPGLIMMAAPSLFAYLTIILIIKFIFKKLSFRYPVFLSVLITLAIGFAISTTLNYASIKKLNELTSQDIELSKPLNLSGTIALIDSVPYLQKRHDPLCGMMCQSLLYNGLAKTVLMAPPYNPSIDTDNYEITAYTIEQQDSCQKDGIIFNRTDKYAWDTVLARMASGECIKKYKTKLSDADYIYSKQEVNISGGYHGYILGIFPLNITSAKARGNRVEVFKKSGGGYEAIYRHTKGTTRLLAYPFMMGPILHTGESWSARFGAARYDKSVNGKAAGTYDGFNDFKDQMKIIFGNGLGSPTSRLTPEEAFSLALSDKNADKSALNKYFEIFLNTFKRGGKKILSEADESLFIKAMHEQRITSYYWISDVVNMASPEQKIRIYQAGVDRILIENVDHRNEIVESLSSLICEFPAIDPNSNDVARLKADNQRLEYVLNYYKKKIAGGWSKNGRIEACVSNWQSVSQ